MSADRELLELAAKAVGYVGCWDSVQLIMCVGEPGSYQKKYWNPLTDDGDALRLAVRLRLGLDIVDYGTSVRAAGQWHGSEAHLHGGIESATRRAIVRAAAAIGKAMP